MHPEFIEFVARERAKEFAKASERAALVAQALAGTDRQRDGRSISIRLCRVDDHPALKRLAELESRQLPGGSFVIGEIDGVVSAAWPLDEDAPALADPFLHTEQLVSLLALRAAQLRRAERRRVPRLRRRTAEA